MLISNPCPNLIKSIETIFLLLGYTKMKPYLGFISKLDFYPRFKSADLILFIKTKNKFKFKFFILLNTF